MNLRAVSGAILTMFIPFPLHSDLIPPSLIIWVSPLMMHMLLLLEPWTWQIKNINVYHTEVTWTITQLGLYSELRSVRLTQMFMHVFHWRQLMIYMKVGPFILITFLQLSGIGIENGNIFAQQGGGGKSVWNKSVFWYQLYQHKDYARRLVQTDPLTPIGLLIPTLLSRKSRSNLSWCSQSQLTRDDVLALSH